MFQEKLFGDLAIWQDEEMRKLTGQFPVIFLSFADIKEETFEAARDQILLRLNLLFLDYEYLRDSPRLSAGDIRMFDMIQPEMKDAVAKTSLKTLSYLLMKHTGRKVIILLDEYDTPMQEAYVNSYWKEIVSFTRGLFNATFKTNPYLDRALMTGITRVSRESLFSDLNNLKVITTTSKKYETAFGFTEQEVLESMEESGFGRYDVMMEPLDAAEHDAILMEFKVHDPDEESSLQDTVQAALRQIEEKQYAQELVDRGFPADHIRSYGFAFEGKTVLIGEATKSAD